MVKKFSCTVSDGREVTVEARTVSKAKVLAGQRLGIPADRVVAVCVGDRPKRQ